MPNQRMRELRTMIERLGVEVIDITRRKNHYLCRLRAGARRFSVTAGGTSSDYRADKNFCADVRREARRQ